MSDAMTVWGEIDGQTITFPMEVTDFDAATLMFSVPADAAQALLPGNDFEVVEMVDGWAQLVIALCDYHQNPWGDYNEINLGFLARPRGASADVVGSFVYAMPVDQEFTCKAGNQVMGFPKTVETIRFERGASHIRVVLMVGTSNELDISFREPVQDAAPSQVETVSYSYLDGAPHETPLTMEIGAGLIDTTSVTVEVGGGILGSQLRTLGLPKAPDFGTWGTGLAATFQLGHPIA